MDFWQDNSAKGWAEIAFNKLVVDSVRMINSGLLPTFQLSPSLGGLAVVNAVCDDGAA